MKVRTVFPTKTPLLKRLVDDIAVLSEQRLADLVANPVQPRVIQPVEGEDAFKGLIRHKRGPRVISATMADSFHSGPTPHTTDVSYKGQSLTDEGTSLSNAKTTGVGFNGDMTATNLTVCQCGMGYEGVEHPCMKWHHKMMTAEAKKDFTEVVKKHCGGYVPNPALSLDLKSPDTQKYIQRAINPPFRNDATKKDVQPVLVRFMPDVLAKLEHFRNDKGQRLTLKPSGKPDPYGVIEIVVFVEDDDEWVKSFAKKHEEKKSAMPICCGTPDPRIAKSGRPYCHSCKKYLDKVPPPQEQTITVTRPVGPPISHEEVKR